MSKPSIFDSVVKRFLILLGLLIFSPIVLSLGFKALEIYTKGLKKGIGYILIAIGVTLVLFTVYYGLKTIKVFLDNLFQK